MSNLKRSFTILFAFLSLPALAQMPRPDSTFGINGRASFGGWTMRVFPNHKILLADVTPLGSSPYFVMATRLLPNGTPDSTYGQFGQMKTTRPLSAYERPGILSNERILLADPSVAPSTFGVRAYHQFGIDSSFGTNGVVNVGSSNNTSYNSTHVDSLDRFFTYGYYVSSSFDYNTFESIDSQGQPIPVYGYHGRSKCEVSDDHETNMYAMALGTKGRLLFGGEAYDNSFIPGSYRIFIARNDSLGNKDMTFNNGNSREFQIAQDNYNILIEGKSYNGMGLLQLPNGTILCSVTRSLYRLRPNGSPDPAFGVDGKTTTVGDTHSINMLNCLALSNGKYLGYGAKKSKAALQRFLGNGQIDSTFAVNGTLELDSIGPVRDAWAQSDTLVFCTPKAIFRYVLGDLSTWVQPVERPNEMILFPNPARTTITLSSGSPLAGNLVFYNASGQSFAKSFLNDSGTQIDISDLAPGLYMCRGTDSKGAVYQGKLSVLAW